MSETFIAFFYYLFLIKILNLFQESKIISIRFLIFLLTSQYLFILRQIIKVK